MAIGSHKFLHENTQIITRLNDPPSVDLLFKAVYNKHPMGCKAQLAWKCLFTPTFWQAILTRKVGQNDLVLVYNQGLLVGLYTQDYKFLCAAIMIRTTLVNIQTHTDRQTDRQHLTSLYE